MNIIVLQVVLTFFFLLILPTMIGSLKFGTGLSNNKLDLMSYIKGMVVMMAIFQLCAVPMILAKQKFSVLVFLWLIIIGGVFIVSVYRTNIKESIITRKHCLRELFVGSLKKERFLETCVCICAILLIVIQMYAYVRYQQIDEDDSRFIVNALEALENNTMLLNNPATGEKVDGFIGELSKDAISPWPFYIALMARMTYVHPAIFAHTIWPVFALFMGYAVYWNLARFFFDGNNKYSWFFLIIASIINLFGNVTRNTEFSFILSRAWQGKAVVAGVFLPLILLWLLKIYSVPERKDNYWNLFLTNMGMCLLSGMGIAMGAFFVGCFGGVLSLLKKDWKMLILLAITCIPYIIYLFVNVVAF